MGLTNDQSEVLKDLYYNPKQPSAFRGVQALYKAAKGNGITMNNVREWLTWVFYLEYTIW